MMSDEILENILDIKYSNFKNIKTEDLINIMKEKINITNSEKIVLSEKPFISFQGEAGQPGALTLFIRTFGCVNFCKNCDTKFSWKDKTEYSLNEIVDFINDLVDNHNYNNSGKFIVNFTGGEPLQQIDKIFNIIKLAKFVNKDNIKFVMETSGNFENEILHSEQDAIHYLSLFDEINISPKTPCMQAEKQINIDKLLYLINRTAQNTVINMKFVVKDNHDIITVKNIINNMENINKSNVYIYLMPLTDYSNKTISDDIKKFVINNALENGWSYSPRLHIENNFK